MPRPDRAPRGRAFARVRPHPERKKDHPMDRATVYAGQIPREVDILNTGRFGMIGLGMLAQAALGTDQVVDGFALNPTAPASLIANLSPGQVYQVANVDGTSWSSLPADSRTIVKQGLALDPTPLTFAPPTTPGYSQAFLVEVQYQDADTDTKVLPYYNAANPTQGFAGPAGSGTAQNTNRRGVAAVQVKAGVAATAGTQQAPSADAGWAPLFIVTLSAGQTSVTAGSIVPHPSAPFFTKLPGVPTASQANKWTYAVAAGANVLSAAIAPKPPALIDGLTVTLACPNANTDAVTFALNGYPAAAVLRRNGTPLKAGDIGANDVVRLTYKGGAWVFGRPVPSEIVELVGTATPSASLWHTGEDLSATNGIIDATVAPAITSYDKGVSYRIRTNQSCTGAMTAVLNGLPARTVTRADGTPLRKNDFVAGQVIDLVDDGANLQLVGVLTSSLPSSAILIFGASTTYTVPAGVTKIKRGRVWGGGGGGGGSTGSAGAGSAGGGGGYEEATDLAVTPGDVLVINVGTGGLGGGNGTPNPASPAGSGTASNGTNGGTSFIGIQGQSAWIVATGGTAGSAGNGGTQTTNAGVGGTGSGPGLSATGGPGSLGQDFGSTKGAGIGGAGAFGGGTPTPNIGIGTNSGNFPAGGANGGVGGYGAGTGGAGLAIIEI